MSALEPVADPLVPTVLITAFEPYGRWETNASWMALVELTRELPMEPKITTRRYPVDYRRVLDLLSDDLDADYDFAIHLGQAPGTASVHLEEFALNVRTNGTSESSNQFCALCDAGPAAYRCELPMEAFASQLRLAGIPADVSHHAGTFLCNATLYWSQHLAREKGKRTRSMFVHLPLDVSQAVGGSPPPPSLAAVTSSQALRLMLSLLVAHHRQLFNSV